MTPQERMEAFLQKAKAELGELWKEPRTIQEDPNSITLLWNPRLDRWGMLSFWADRICGSFRRGTDSAIEGEYPRPTGEWSDTGAIWRLRWVLA